MYLVSKHNVQHVFLSFINKFYCHNLLSHSHRAVCQCNMHKVGIYNMYLTTIYVHSIYEI